MAKIMMANCHIYLYYGKYIHEKFLFLFLKEKVREFTLDPNQSPLIFSPSKQQRDFTPSLGKPNDASLSSLEKKTGWNFKRFHQSHY